VVAISLLYQPGNVTFPYSQKEGKKKKKKKNANSLQSTHRVSIAFPQQLEGLTQIHTPMLDIVFYPEA